jgi:hypothetical protein
MKEIYISTDVEVDGPIPGPHSMRSLGSAAFEPDKTLVSTFHANLEPLPGATSHPDTMAWWEKHPEAWDVVCKDPQSPSTAMTDYVRWIESLPGHPVFVGYPAAFDFLFVYWYLMKYVGRSPFSFAALDIKTMAMVMLDRDYRRCSKKDMPKRWFDNLPHTHRALDDAIEQGALFCNMLAECRRKKK